MPLLAKPGNYKGSEVLTQSPNPGFHWRFDFAVEFEDRGPAGASAHKTHSLFCFRRIV
jgi:hypothetical protein